MPGNPESRPTMPRPTTKAVAFDCDGLMFNTEDVFERAGHELLGRRELKFSSEVRGLMLGRRAEEAFTALIDHFGLPDTVAELIAEGDAIFARHLPDLLEPMPGLFDLLDDLDRRGMPLAVATSSGRAYLDDLLGRFGLADRFAATLAAEDVSRGKPHPEIYRAAADRLGVRPAELMVLEDSGTGLRAAAEAGTVAVAVPNRHTAAMDFGRATLIAEGLGDPRIRALLDGV